jgi:two-component system response regulator YesN
LNQSLERRELLKLDRSAVENYLRCGAIDKFDNFFDAYLRPLSETALRSTLIKNYIFVDVILVTAKLVDELGAKIDRVIPEVSSIEMILSSVKSVEQLRDQAYRIISIGLAYRDSHGRIGIEP